MKKRVANLNKTSKRYLLSLVVMLSFLVTCPVYSQEKDSLFGPYDKVIDKSSTSEYYRYIYQLGEDKYGVINGVEFGPYKEISFASYDTLGFKIKKEDGLYVHYDNEMIGPFQDIVRTTVSDGELIVLYKKESKFFLYRGGKTIGPLLNLKEKIGGKNLQYYKIGAKGDDWYVLAKDRDSYEAQKFIYLNGKEYGPFSSVDRKNTQEGFALSYTDYKQKEHGLIVNGIQYGPYKTIMDPYPSNLEIFEEGNDWWVDFYQHQWDSESRKFTYQYKHLFNGQESSSSWYKYVDMDKRETYYLSHNNKEYGPYPRLVNQFFMNNYGFPFYSSRPNQYSLFYFCYQDDEKRYFCNVNDDVYGPFDEVMRVKKSSTNNQWGLEAWVGDKKYVYVNGVKHGPYDDVRNFTMNNDNWAFGYRVVDNFFIKHNDNDYSLNLSVEEAETGRVGIFYSKEKHKVYQQCHFQCPPSPGSLKIQFLNEQVVLPYKIDQKMFYFICRKDKGKLMVERKIESPFSEESEKKESRYEIEIVKKEAWEYVKIYKDGLAVGEIKKSQLSTKEVKSNKYFDKLKGKIILKVEDKGKAYYLHPQTRKLHFLGRPHDAFRVMKEQGVGISEKDYNNFGNRAPNRMSGKILLRVEAKGEAYYISPIDLKMHYLGRPADAFNVMRKIGLGVSNSDFNEMSN